MSSSTSSPAAAGANTVITLKIDGGDQLALARQIQRHPVKGTLLHVDFVRIRADQTVDGRRADRTSRVSPKA